MTPLIKKIFPKTYADLVAFKKWKKRRIIPFLKIFLRERLVVEESLDCAPLKLGIEHTSEFHRLDALKEPETVKWVEDSVRPGSVFYDIGSCVGAYALIAASRGATVCAFEPSFSNYAALVGNIQMNGLEKSITAFPVALSKTTGLVGFRYSSTNPGSAGHSFEAGEGFTQQVLGISLDELVELFRLPWPTLVKIDVDGHELAVIDGGKRTLSRASALLIEEDVREKGQEQIEGRLRDLGFYKVAEYQRASRAIKNVLYQKK